MPPPPAPCKWMTASCDSFATWTAHLEDPVMACPSCRSHSLLNLGVGRGREHSQRPLAGRELRSAERLVEPAPGAPLLCVSPPRALRTSGASASAPRTETSAGTFTTKTCRRRTGEACAGRSAWGASRSRAVGVALGPRNSVPWELRRRFSSPLLGARTPHPWSREPSASGGSVRRGAGRVGFEEIQAPRAPCPQELGLLYFPSFTELSWTGNV